MNVIFHTTTAIGITTLITDTNRLGNSPSLKETIPTASAAFVLGVISHGALDYIPHCYPINSKIDVVAASLMILAATWFVNKPYRPIAALSFLGSIFPDLIDLGPKLANKYLELGLSIPENIFSWHWHEYSGSIYSGDCDVSNLNHLLVIVTVAVICWARKTDLKYLIKRKTN
jgi:hypothetical protein